MKRGGNRGESGMDVKPAFGEMERKYERNVCKTAIKIRCLLQKQRIKRTAEYNEYLYLYINMSVKIRVPKYIKRSTMAGSNIKKKKTILLYLWVSLPFNSLDWSLTQ